jgi:PAS domain S-box-containing protein
VHKLIPIMFGLVGVADLCYVTLSDMNIVNIVPLLSLLFLLGFVIFENNNKHDSRLEDAIENIGDGLALYDKEDRLVLCNTPYQDMFSPIKDVLIAGKQYEDILKVGIQRGLYPPVGQDADEWLKMRLELRKKNNASREERLIDGRWLLVRESIGKDGFRVSIRTDITHMKERDKRLRQLHRAVDQSASMVILTDHQGSIEYVNKRFVEDTGYQKHEVIGKSHNFFSGGETSQTEYRRIWQTITKGQVWRGEINRRRKNGELYWVYLTISPIKDYDGHITHYVGIEDDITYRKKTEKALRQAKENAVNANKAKTDFLTNMSHELRTPLNHVIGFSDMLKKQSVNNLTQEKFDQYLGCIYEAGSHLLEVVNSILEAAQIESKSIVLEKKNFNSGDLISACSNQFQERFKTTNLHLESIIPDDAPLIYGDGVRIQQILLNLLSNAIKFSHSGDTITLGGRLLENNMFEYFVKDTGCGIEDEKQKDIFAMFEQVDNSLTRAHQGIGLGLALAKHLTDLHNGHLSFESQKDVGSTFYLRIPL